MEQKQVNEVRQIRDAYTEKGVTKLDELKALNKKVVTPADIFAYTFGIIGALVLGLGMCLAMQVIGANTSFAMPLGIVIGLVGIFMVSVNYPLYKKILAERKKKYAKQVLSLTDELLNN